MALPREDGRCQPSPSRVGWMGCVSLDAIGVLASQAPFPKIRTEPARRAAERILLHIIMLVESASQLNAQGRHSCALSLLRPLEDALDCLAAVSLVPDAAERWQRGELRPSDAARVSEHEFPPVVLPDGAEAADYRKGLRTHFNRYAHCSPELVSWDLYLSPDSEAVRQVFECPEQERTISIELRANHDRRLLEQNAVRVSAYLAAHVSEVISVIEMAYDVFLSANPQAAAALLTLKAAMEAHLVEHGPVYLDDCPPELQQLVMVDPSDPTEAKALLVDPDSDPDLD